MNQLKNLAILFYTIFIWQASSAQNTAIPVAIEPDTTTNQLRLGAGYIAFGTGDLRGIQAYGQYLYKFNPRLGISLGANISHASVLSSINYDPNKQYTLLSNLTENPFNSYENYDVGGNQYEPHFDRTTHFIVAVNINYYLLDRKRTKLKAATGLAFTYLDRNSIAEVREVLVNETPTSTEFEEMVFITPVYERLSDWGWTVQLDYEYHFSNRVFTNAGLAFHNFFDIGDTILSIRFGVGVNF
ncbi:MAG: hypothetical protein AAGG75_08715 [Bacteroidota bacterium]